MTDITLVAQIISVTTVRVAAFVRTEAIAVLRVVNREADRLYDVEIQTVSAMAVHQVFSVHCNS